MIDVSIDIRAENLEKAKEMLEAIAFDISRDAFSAGCSKEQQESYDGTVFVTEATALGIGAGCCSD
mgnify:CR=1 FL=1